MIDSTGLKPIQASRGLSVKFAAASIWLAFTLALAGWWLIFGLNQLSEMRELATTPRPDAPVSSEVFDRQHRMLLSEGVFLIVLLMGGGAALLYNLLVERRRARMVEEFFASFTHDLKTSLASLRIQTESLRDELDGQAANGGKKLLDRIMSDAGRLETQLENALYFADAENAMMMAEPIEIRSVIESLSHHWPNMEFRFSGDRCRIMGDRRAMESVIRNLAQNANRHGRATKLDIQVSRSGDFVTVNFQDNGSGFGGDVKRLGKIFDRQTGGSGSGIGLYLVARLIEKQNGRVRVAPPETGRGFGVSFDMPSGEPLAKAAEGAKS